MERGEQHLEQALLNEQLALWLAAREPERAAGWSIIMLFYSALHYFDAYLEGICRVVSPSHEAQDANLLADPLISETNVVPLYHSLREASVEARYNLRNYSVADFDHYYNDCFVPIKRTITSIINLD